jgi:hypothetical protein
MAASQPPGPPAIDRLRTEEAGPVDHVESDAILLQPRQAGLQQGISMTSSRCSLTQSKICSCVLTACRRINEAAMHHDAPRLDGLTRSTATAHAWVMPAPSTHICCYSLTPDQCWLGGPVAPGGRTLHAATTLPAPKRQGSGANLVATSGLVPVFLIKSPRYCSDSPKP